MSLTSIISKILPLLYECRAYMTVNDM